VAVWLPEHLLSPTMAYATIFCCYRNVLHVKDQHWKIYVILSDMTKVTNLSNLLEISFHRNLEDKT
jgi:hypothetical protein